MYHRLTRTVLLIAVSLTLALSTPGATWASSSAKKKQETEVDGLNYLRLPTVSASIIRKSRVRGVLDVNVELEIPNLDIRNHARKLRPRLSHEYHRVVTYFAGTHVTMGKAISLARLEYLLQRATNKVLGHEEVTVLIENAAVRRL